jgi:hypothetical protein
MKIPKKFKLGSRTWKVIIVGKRKWYGSCSVTKCTIKLSSLNKTNEEAWHTFCHELMHAISGTIGFERLNKDEDKIDAMGNMLAQALESFK